jgi:hypothetical protein
MDIKRNLRRSEISLRCPCRTIDGVPLELELLDLSERGCLARPIGFPLQFGQALRLFPEGCDAFTATVRRTDEAHVGIEFDRELPHPVFERMRSYVPAPDEFSGNDLPSDHAVPPAAQPADIAGTDNPQPYGSLLGTGRDKPRVKKMAIT